MQENPTQQTNGFGQPANNAGWAQPAVYTDQTAAASGQPAVLSQQPKSTGINITTSEEDFLFLLNKILLATVMIVIGCIAGMALNLPFPAAAGFIMISVSVAPLLRIILFITAIYALIRCNSTRVGENARDRIKTLAGGSIIAALLGLALTSLLTVTLTLVGVFFGGNVLLFLAPLVAECIALLITNIAYTRRLERDEEECRNEMNSRL